MTTMTDEERSCPVCKSIEDIVAIERYNRWQKVYYMDLKCTKCGSRWHSRFYRIPKKKDNWFDRAASEVVDFLSDIFDEFWKGEN